MGRLQLCIPARFLQPKSNRWCHIRSEPNRHPGFLFGTYLQDDYRINSRLTLNLGLPTNLHRSHGGKRKMSFLRDPTLTTLQIGNLRRNHLNSRRVWIRVGSQGMQDLHSRRRESITIKSCSTSS